MAGSPNLFRQEIGRNLNTVFPPQYGGFEVPVILGGTVNLVHDFPGTAPFLNFSIYDSVGAVDVVSVVAAVVPPPGFIWIIDEMSILANNEPANRDISLRVRYVTPLGTFVVTVFRGQTGTASLPQSIGRRLILPPGAALDLSVPALTAGANLRWTAMYLQVGAGQFVPKG